MTHAPSLVALAVLAAALGPAAAQKVAPGLWETTMNMQSNNPELQANMARMREQMAKMPPEQRKMMEDMMAKQGVSMGAAGGANTVRYCLSKEQAERGDIPQDNESRCKRDSVERSGSTMRFKVTCTNPPSSGTGEITFKGDKAYDSKITWEHPRQGKVERMEMTGQARWVSADCGNLAPVGGAAGKK